MSAIQFKDYNFPRGQYFRHIDGGYYMYDRLVYSSEDKSVKVVYDHLWPFEVAGWERPAQEFFDKFTPITEEEFHLALNKNQTELREQIAQHKAERRAKEKQA